VCQDQVLDNVFGYACCNDVIVMGTLGGVDFARTPPAWMKAGDTIEVEIDGLGVLPNPIVA
jgi:acylpyruvate hydrolase